MAKTADSPDAIIDAIRSIERETGRVPSKADFIRHSGMSEHQVLKHFPDGYSAAVKAAGLQPNMGGSKRILNDDQLLEEYGRVVRQLRQIPTAAKFNYEGKYNSATYSGRFGPWSNMPRAFSDFARGKPEWVDVVALLPVTSPGRRQPVEQSDGTITPAPPAPARHSKLTDRATYGNPIDFRGLRHEPVNEQGVVFLFGMIARELGYYVEAVQTGFPDCEAKRQVGRNNWQRVRIEFEFESRNFRDHGHACDGCDVIVCWRHNWPDLPDGLEVVELSTMINSLSKSED
jgi:hypothetical protein